MIAVANSRHRLFVKNISSFISKLVNDFDKQWLEQSLVYPLLKTKKGYVIAETNFTPFNAYEKFNAAGTGVKIHTVYTTKAQILEAIHSNETVKDDSNINLVTVLLLQDKITWEQAVLALDNQSFIPDILGYMGLKSGWGEKMTTDGLFFRRQRLQRTK